MRVPGLSWLKALSVGAKSVSPSKELFSWLVSCWPTWVSLSRRSRVVYCPPLSRMPVRFSGAGVGPGATVAATAKSAGDARGRRRRRRKCAGAIVVIVRVER